MSIAVVTGGSSGLGKLICQHLNQNYDVINWSLDTGVDVRSSDAVKAAAAVAARTGPIAVLVNCAGINRIDFIPELAPVTWNDVMDTNARGIFYTTKALCDHMRGGTILNIVSNAAHVPMTSSLAYNASKAASLIMTKQMARELGKTHDITCFSVSPNKLKGTGMSSYIEERVCKLRGWTPEQAAQYQLAALPAGAETPPEVLAEFIGFLLSSKERHRYLQGVDLTYGGPN
jgi:NAD(P)-dependent dehydrogenase (short-subunit alcohol dehydrogenase family)